MKALKRIFALLVAVVMLFTLAACGNEKSSRKSKKDKNNDGDSSVVGMVETKLVIGSLVSVPGKADFYVDYCQITDKVIPPSVDGAYSYYGADEGKVYIDVCLGFKNLATEAVNVSDLFDCEVTYSGAYKYSTFEVAEEDNRGSFSSYENLDPLSQEYVHILCEVPSEVQTSGKPVSLAIEYEGRKYSFDVRNNITGQVSVTPPQSSGNNSVPNTKPTDSTVNAETITDKQVISHAGVCDFYVDSCNISYDVKPPVLESFYTYYAGDEGKVYVDVCISYKNLATSAISVDDITDPTLTYAGAYKYDGFVVAETDGRTSFSSYENFDPLTTEYMHLLVQVPDEVQTSGQSVEVFFKIAGTDYRYKVK